VLKRTYFMTAIDGELCLRMATFRSSRLSKARLMSVTYNTTDHCSEKQATNVGHEIGVWLFRPFAGSLLACSLFGSFAPWLVRPLACLPRGSLAPSPWTFCPR